MNDQMLKNKHIVIIGGTTGLGLSASMAFIRQGAKVIAVGRNPEHNAAAQLQFGDMGRVITGDATHENTAVEAINLCIKLWESFDGLYHVAGGSGRKMGDGPLHKLSMEGWMSTIELNLTSVMLSNRAAIFSFLEQKRGGTILNMGSVLSHYPAPHYFTTHAYAAAKAAIEGLSKSSAAHYAKHNIRINVIAAGLIETPMAQRAAQDADILNYMVTKQPLDGGRIGQPGDLDAAACYFMSDLSGFTTGQVLAIDGGWGVSEGQISSRTT
ncbi:SDR family NAD(P)-dependent oxidoreductase [Pedobacter heparinus]|uniref:SDR family NAD(P)-dependent oxidoreductase n=1 Tax=Pedobacter heparinus TaxID=984 RepID=UPI0029318864|nr:SDR family oxidoreductase [Pedobacter heparinus]